MACTPLKPRLLASTVELAQVDRNCSVLGRRDGAGSLAAADEHVQALGERTALVEADRLRLAVDFLQHALELVVQHAAVAGEGAGGGLRRQRAGAVQKLGNVADAAVGDLQLARPSLAFGIPCVRTASFDR